MTSAPFRDLFVELPAAAFESLQAYAEALVVRASRPAPPAPPPPRPSLFVDRYIRAWLRAGHDPGDEDRT